MVWSEEVQNGAMLEAAAPHAVTLLAAPRTCQHVVQALPHLQVQLERPNLLLLILQHPFHDLALQALVFIAHAA